jgi:hypothetical protein
MPAHKQDADRAGVSESQRPHAALNSARVGQTRGYHGLVFDTDSAGGAGTLVTWPRLIARHLAQEMHCLQGRGF